MSRRLLRTLVCLRRWQVVSKLAAHVVSTGLCKVSWTRLRMTFYPTRSCEGLLRVGTAASIAQGFADGCFGLGAGLLPPQALLLTRMVNDAGASIVSRGTLSEANTTASGL